MQFNFTFAHGTFCIFTLSAETVGVALFRRCPVFTAHGLLVRTAFIFLLLALLVLFAFVGSSSASPRCLFCPSRPRYGVFLSMLPVMLQNSKPGAYPETQHSKTNRVLRFSGVRSFGFWAQGPAATGHNISFEPKAQAGGGGGELNQKGDVRRGEGRGDRNGGITQGH